MSLRHAITCVFVCLLSSCAPRSLESTPETTKPPPVEQSELAAFELAEVQTIYTPIYSHINTGSGGTAFNLAVTLAIRNIDADSPIILKSVEYFDTAGKRLHGWLDRPVRLGQMATYSFFVREDDITGGIGANVRVEWIADGGVNPPLVEAVHASTASGLGVSFVTRGVAVRHPENVGDKP